MSTLKLKISLRKFHKTYRNVKKSRKLEKTDMQSERTLTLDYIFLNLLSFENLQIVDFHIGFYLLVQMSETCQSLPPPARGSDLEVKVMNLEIYCLIVQIQMSIRPLVKSAYQKNNILPSQPKHMLWVLKRTVSMRRFFLSTQKIC